MKKFLPLLIVVLGFTGFLSAQLIWDRFQLNAQQIDQDKGKHQLFNNLYRELKLTTYDKKVIEPKSIKTPLVVFNFWASWCLPCLKEFPSLVEFQKKYGDKVTIVGFNGDEENPDRHIREVSKSYKLDFAQVADPKSEISDKFMIVSYPYSIVYHQGKVIHVSHKIQNFMEPEFLATIDSALRGK